MAQVIANKLRRANADSGTIPIALLAASLALLVACKDARPRRPSIVFLSIDTLAAGHTSLHRYARPTTPQLEVLAREAVVFERARANAHYTTPSYVSQFTGLTPGCMRVDRDGFKQQFGRPPTGVENWNIPALRTTLTESLAAAGYRTAGFIDNLFAASPGIEQGFEVYDRTAAEITALDWEGGIRTVVPRALAWIDGLPRDEPFFLFLNVLDVHGPYLPPPGFSGRFAAKTVDGRQELLRVSSGDICSMRTIPRAAIAGLPPPLPTEVTAASVTARYDEEILAVDHECGRFLEELRARGLFDDILLIVSADHGEAMDEPHNRYQHSTFVEDVLHVPLLLKLPGSKHGGQRIATPVQLLDLYPTLAEILGLDPPSHLQGRSLVPLWEGRAIPESWFFHEGVELSSAVTDGEWRLIETRPEVAPVHVLLNHPRGNAWAEAQFPGLREIDWGLEDLLGELASAGNLDDLRKRARKDIQGPFYELYHLPTDPHQLRDVAEEHDDIVQRLKQHLVSGGKRSAAERDRVPVRGEVSSVVVPTEELKALGYGGDE